MISEDAKLKGATKLDPPSLLFIVFFDLIILSMSTASSCVFVGLDPSSNSSSFFFAISEKYYLKTPE